MEQVQKLYIDRMIATSELVAVKWIVNKRLVFQIQSNFQASHTPSCNLLSGCHAMRVVDELPQS